MSVIMPSEMDDFRAACRGRGFRVEEFKITETTFPAMTDGPAPDRGSATIMRVTTGQERTYATGHSSHWVVDFEDDLARGVFGAP